MAVRCAWRERGTRSQLESRRLRRRRPIRPMSRRRRRRSTTPARSFHATFPTSATRSSAAGRVCSTRSCWSTCPRTPTSSRSSGGSSWSPTRSRKGWDADVEVLRFVSRTLTTPLDQLSPDGAPARDRGPPSGRPPVAHPPRPVPHLTSILSRRSVDCARHCAWTEARGTGGSRTTRISDGRCPGAPPRPRIRYAARRVGWSG
jgi:hypothetical protein